MMPFLTDGNTIPTPYDCITVPPKAAGPAKIDDLPTRLVQHEMRQGCRARRQAFVCLLQHNDVGPHVFDDLQDTLRLTPEIQPEAFLNVIAGDT